MKLSLVYAFFAVLATAVNIGIQDLAIRSYSGPFALLLSVGMGTIGGLLLKYVLDKRYIFRFQPDNALHDSGTFLLYSLMGVVTTAVFWSFEFGFNYLFETKEMRYLGAIIGLGIGYLSKYHLDRKFVFRKESVA